MPTLKLEHKLLHKILADPTKMNQTSRDKFEFYNSKTQQKTN